MRDIGGIDLVYSSPSVENMMIAKRLYYPHCCTRHPHQREREHTTSRKTKVHTDPTNNSTSLRIYLSRVYTSIARNLKISVLVKHHVIAKMCYGPVIVSVGHRTLSKRENTRTDHNKEREVHTKADLPYPQTTWNMGGYVHTNWIYKPHGRERKHTN